MKNLLFLIQKIVTKLGEFDQCWQNSKMLEMFNIKHKHNYGFKNKRSNNY